MSKKETVNYVENEEFLHHLKVHREKVKAAKEAGKPEPQQSNEIGLAILAISTNLAKSSNFSGYPFKDEMIMDGIENAVKAVASFNTDKYDKPFSYFSKVIYWAFVRRIQKEKKALYTKFKYIEKSVTDGKPVAINYDTDYMKSFIRDYDEAQEKKKQKALERATLKFEDEQNNEVNNDESDST